MAPVGLALVDDQSVVRWSPTFASHAGGDDEHPAGQALDALVDMARGADLGPDERIAAGEELHIATADGEESWIETRCAEIDDLDHSMRILATFDVTARKQLELDLQRLSHLFRNANDIITVVDETGETLYASPSNERILGYPDGWRTPGGVLAMIHPDDLPTAAARFEAVLNGDEGSEQPIVVRVRTYQGGWKYFETIGINLLHELSVRGIVLTSRDVTERQQLSDQLAHRATHDALTDLPNRAAAEDRLGLALIRARQDRSVAGVCYLDLDGFKVVNDTLGSPADSPTPCATPISPRGSVATSSWSCSKTLVDPTARSTSPGGCDNA
jgi:PAS domain S-box-containing protein